MKAMETCGIVDVAERTGLELCPFEHVPLDMYKIDRPISFNEFPVPRPVRDADVYIGLPKMKVHVHTVFTGALKLQFGNLPDYDWMVRWRLGADGRWGLAYAAAALNGYLTGEGGGAEQDRRPYKKFVEPFVSKHLLFPIPIVQLQLSSVKQNPGW